MDDIRFKRIKRRLSPQGKNGVSRTVTVPKKWLRNLEKKLGHDVKDVNIALNHMLIIYSSEEEVDEIEEGLRLVRMIKNIAKKGKE